MRSCYSLVMVLIYLYIYWITFKSDEDLCSVVEAFLFM